MSRPAGTAGEVFLAFLKLGCTSFGGPVAHLGYYRAEIVERRRWLDERSYADLVALCQFLPGPASSQTGMGIGLARAGIPGMFAAWIGFTLPSAVLMVLFALGVAALPADAGSGWLDGLKIAAVAVVAQAVWGMARSLTPDAERVTLAAAAAIFVLAWPTPAGQVLAILAGGLFGWARLRAEPPEGPPTPLAIAVPAWLAPLALALFFLLLAGLPLLAAAAGDGALPLVDAFYRAGSLVFGGGHVVLPLLQSETVARGWLDGDTFLAGYGAAQAVPGPLFTFAAYLGPAIAGAAGGVIALLAIFAPSFLLMLGVLPYWDRLRAMGAVQAALRGVNAAVVGLLLAALYDPVWTGAIHDPADFAIGLAAFVALVFWRVPPWAVVALAAAAGVGIEAAGWR